MLQNIINIELNQNSKNYVLTINEGFNWELVDNKVIIKKNIKTVSTIDEIRLINFRNSRVEKVSYASSYHLPRRNPHKEMCWVSTNMCMCG